MTPKQFESLVVAMDWNPDSRTAQACKMVMVDGHIAKDAALELGITKAAVSRALKKIRNYRQCPVCGHKL